MKKTALFFALFLLFTACQETLEERAAREAREYTEKNCPTHAGNGVMLDSMVFDIESRTLNRYFTMTGKLDDVNALNNVDVRMVLLQELKNFPSYKTYLEAGFNFRYVYRSQSRPELILFDTTLTEKDYR